jgi:hypothetical protein
MVDKPSSPLQQAQTQWLYDTEKQLVLMDKGKSFALDADSDTLIGTLSEYPMRYAVVVRNLAATHLIDPPVPRHSR